MDHELLDPTLGDELAIFFERALQRDARERFDTGEEMLRAWRRVFERADWATSTEDGTFDPHEIAARVALDDPLVALGANARISDALRRANAETVRDLLSISLLDLNRLRGVGNQTRRDALRVVQALRQRFEEEAKRAAGTNDRGLETDGRSVDRIAQRLIPRSLDESEPATSALRLLLGLAPGSGDDDWLDVDAVASTLGTAVSEIESALERGRASWSRVPALRQLRNDVAELITRNGGVVSLGELVALILAARGSQFEAPLRWRHAFAAARAALEAEAAAATPRFVVDAVRRGSPIVAIDGSDLPAAIRIDYADALGGVADELALADPLPTPIRVIEELRKVEAPAGESMLSEARLVRLAAASSLSAASSVRLELYPRGMAAERALKLAQGTLLTATDGLTPAELRERVRARFAEAEPLPERPVLDRLVGKLDVALRWDGAAQVYRWPSAPSSGDTSVAVRRRTTSLAKPTQLDPDVQEANEVEKRLANALETGGFVALMVSPVLAEPAIHELVRRFELEVVNFDRVLIHHMKLFAAQRGVSWSAVIRADGRPPDSLDWTRLQTIVRGATPKILEDLLSMRGHVLAVHAGLLSRYGLLALIEQIRDRAGTTAGPESFWLLLPADEIEEAPVLNGRAIPVLASFQWLRLTRAWVENRHRAAVDDDAFLEAERAR
jgi:hypothetical protein